jgi:hypothetical protein
MTDRATALRVLAALGRTPIQGDAVLVGSSGLERLVAILEGIHG